MEQFCYCLNTLFLNYKYRLSNFNLTLKNKFGQLWKESFSEFVTSALPNIDELGTILLGPKDKEEIKNIKKSASLNTHFYKNFMIEEMIKYISGSKIVTNQQFSNMFEKFLQNEKIWRKIGGMKDMV